MSAANTANAVKKLVVFGGTGFLGKRIVENAVKRGFDVTSITGSGRMPRPYPQEDNSWMEQVKWKQGNVFFPETYERDLQDCTAVVHSIGILLENDSYKKIVGSEDGLINTVSSLFTTNPGTKTTNPMMKTPTDDVTGPNVVIDKTYKRYNTESALVLAESLIDVNRGDKPPAFAYISADRGFPGLPSGYIQSKREAEYQLYQLQPRLRPILLRPGFMYDPSEGTQGHMSMRSSLRTFLDGLNEVNSKLLFNALDGIVRPTISTKTVAQWCMDRIEDPDFHGPVMLDEMINIKK